MTEKPSLETDKLGALNQAVEERLVAQTGSRKREAFLRALLDTSLIKSIKQPQITNGGLRRLGLVQGQPVSETIIEERR